METRGMYATRRRGCYTTSAIAVMAAILVLLLSAKLGHGQRISRHWWAELKPWNNHNESVGSSLTGPIPSGWSVSPIHASQGPSSVYSYASEPIIRAENDHSPSDDELMTQASRLNSQMIRKPPYELLGRSASINPAHSSAGTYRRAAMIRYDDENDEMIDDHNKLAALKRFQSLVSPTLSKTSRLANFYEPQPTQHQSAASNRLSSFSPARPLKPETRFDEAKSDLVWSYFDSTKANGKRPNTWSRTVRRQEEEDVDDIMNRHISRAMKRHSSKSTKKPKSSSSLPSATSSKKEDTNIMKLDFGGRRNKNPEQKQKWRQLVQSIFDSTPREYGYGYGSISNQKQSLDRVERKLTDVFEETDSLGRRAPDEDENNEELDNANTLDEDLVEQDKESPSDIGEDGDDEDEQQDDGNNQYLKASYVYKNDSTKDDSKRKRSPEQANDANSTTTKTPHITLHLKMLTATPTTTQSSIDSDFVTTEAGGSLQNDQVDEDSLEEHITSTTMAPMLETTTEQERNETTTTTTTIELTTTVSPFEEDLSRTKRKQRRMGTWPDASFDDREHITKMIARKSPVVINPSVRRARQNANIDVSGDSELAALSRTMRGTPGQDYGVFGSIPKTSFSCRGQQWPGYYADAETKCQVYHICQQGGRRDSFLCPNGTMFNQQLFVCDWWHNVQCEEVASFYGLNEHIYDKWHANKDNCNDKPAKRLLQRDLLDQNNRVRRMGDIQENTVNITNHVTPAREQEMSTNTVTKPSFTITESVFGTRKAVSESEDGKSKRQANTGGDIKGSASSNRFEQYSRLTSETSTNNKMSPFLVRYNYVNQHVDHPKSSLVLGASGSTSASSVFRGKYHRI